MRGLGQRGCVFLAAVCLAGCAGPAAGPQPMPPEVILGEPVAMSAADRAVEFLLNESLKQLHAEREPLEKVLNGLRDHLEGRLAVNWSALEAAGVDRNTPITLSLREVPVYKALRAALAEAGSKDLTGFAISNGMIVVSTRSDLESEKYLETRAYDIRNLLVPVGAREPSPEVPRRLIAEIRSTIAPGTWKDAGGMIGTMRVEGSRLIVRHTHENHLFIYGLIEERRERNAVQVAWEGRLLLVANNFLDDFRIGWNLNLPRDGSTVPTAGAREDNAAVIDNWTLTVLLQASQSDRRTWTYPGPRITIPNGYAGTLLIHHDPGIIPSSPPFPVAATARLVPTVSVDRRYVVAHVVEVKLQSRTKLVPSPDIGSAPPLPAPNPAVPEVNSVISIPTDGTLLVHLGTLPDDPAQRVGLLLMRPSIQPYRRIEADFFTPTQSGPATLPAGVGLGVPPSARPYPLGFASTEPLTITSYPTTGDTRRRHIAALVGDARRLYDLGRYAEAADLLLEATLIDPQDENAALFLRLLRSKILEQQHNNLAPRGENLQPQSLESIIPYNDLLISGTKEWPKIYPAGAGD